MFSPDLIIVDAYGLIFRSYYAQIRLTNNHGQEIGALYSFTSMLIKIIEQFSPKKFVIAFDSGEKNFRHKLYKEYKANRPDVPLELKKQFPLAQNASKALNICSIALDNTEADDVIASLTNIAITNNEKTLIISSDKDFMQLVSDNVQIYDPAKNTYYDINKVVEKFEITPNKFRDFLAIIGDKSDNISGVRGIGPKGAVNLLKTWNNLENIFINIDKISSNKQKNQLIQNKEEALLSYKLVGLKNDLELNINYSELKWSPPPKLQISEFLQYHGFLSLESRTNKLFNYERQAESKLNFVSKKEDLEKIIDLGREKGFLVILFWQQKEELIALELSVDSNQSYVIYVEEANRWWKDQIIKLLCNPEIINITYDLKGLLRVIMDEKIEAKSVEDILLMFYSFNAGKVKNFSFANILQKILLKPVEPKIGFLSILVLRCYHELIQKLKENKSLSLYYDVDLPLTHILFDMEVNGVTICKELLNSLTEEFSSKILKIEKEIFTLAGEEFNLASPKQLGEILFEKLNLPRGKKSKKTKNYSTDIKELEKLSFQGFHIVDLIIHWRHFQKLTNTYTDSLVNHINKKTGKVHTHYMQAATSTARLSSVNPNLQNIPIRTEEGKKIRQSFISSPDYKFVIIDYSQIELRILSTISKDPVLKKAFKDNKDIHKDTACQIFNLNPKDVTEKYRNNAKVINFSIIYGISSFSLAQRLKISNYEASRYIKNYFNKYPGIKKYIDTTIDFARKNGYVKNMIGRKCYIENINHSNHNLRSFAERVAINAPIQGTNADIMRLAMINLNKIIKNYDANILLQIHDELVFEVAAKQVDELMPKMKNSMENIFLLDVPLVTRVYCQDNWNKD